MSADAGSECGVPSFSVFFLFNKNNIFALAQQKEEKTRLELSLIFFPGLLLIQMILDFGNLAQDSLTIQRININFDCRFLRNVKTFENFLDLHAGGAKGKAYRL